MTTRKTYVACEPDELAMFRDQDGKLHETREKALEANFMSDFNKVVREMPLAMTNAMMIKTFIQENPDMVAIIQGKRDFT